MISRIENGYRYAIPLLACIEPLMQKINAQIKIPSAMNGPMQMKTSKPLAFMKTKHSSKQLGAFLVSAVDKHSLAPLIEQLQRRFWSCEVSIG